MPALVNAFSARACLKMPPMYQSASCESPAYLFPPKRFLPSFCSDWWQCMPLPLSPTRGFGMNVAVLP